MDPRSVSAGHGWTWISRGFALFMKSPAMWVALLLILFGATKLLASIPRLGVFLGFIFMLLLYVFVAGLMDGCRALERGERLELAHLTLGFRKNAAQLVTIGGISLVGNLVVMMVVYMLGGEAMSTMAKTMTHNTPMTPQLAGELQTAVATIGRAVVIGTLVSLPLLMGLLYAPLLVYFHDVSPIAAMKSSFVACLRNTLPMLVYGLVIMAGIFITMPISMALGQYDLAVWLLAPVVLPSLYISYKDIFLSETATPVGTTTVAS